MIIHPQYALQISKSKTTDEIQAALSRDEAANIIAEAGYTKPLVISGKDTLLSTILTYHLFIKSKAMMDQFCIGLEKSGVYEFMKRYEDQIRPLFVDERSPLTAGVD